MPVQRDVSILKNETIGPACGKLTLAGGAIAEAAEPGQFVMIRLNPDGRAPLLPRPFSIHRVNMEKESMEVLFRIVGPGTVKMAALRPGDTINITGPLGQGFRVPAGLRRAALAAGGMGVAPLVFLAERLAATGVDMIHSPAFIGGCLKTDLHCENLFRAFDMPVYLTTEDGSAGRKGLITSCLEEIVSADAPELIFACGPLPMLAAVAAFAARLGIECQVSIETMMACGIGACLGCAVRPAGGQGPFLHACKDGPVFDSRRIDLAGLAENHG